MKLYAYRYADGRIEQAEVEVEEKVVLVPKEQENIPFIYEKQIGKTDVGEVVGYYPTVFLKSPDSEYAKDKFLENMRKVLAEKEDTSEKFQKAVEALKEEIRVLEQESEETE